MTNYYDILGVSQTCSREELKRSYHNLAREHHPDKTNGQESTRFHDIDQAWKVLSDDQLRKKYDAHLKASESDETHPVQEEIHLSEAVYNEDLKQYEKECRCGGSYVLSECDVGEDLLVVDCDNCSLSIVVDCDIVKNKDS